ncbi:MAG: zinc metallopeptidase [Rhizobiaceae bacterium]
MAFIGIFAIVGLVGFILWPQYWVKRVMKTHGEERDDFPGTGGELAKHLLDHYSINGVGVEQTDKGDHYDPEDRMVRLSADNFTKSSLTAVAVAAHEVGHAMQHFDGLQGERDGGLGLRQKLVSLAQVSDKIASVFFIAAPVLAVVARTPLAFFGLIAFGVALLAVRILVHLVTLPVEYDASFGKALPILEEGGYLHVDDLPAARSVLKAAALTYVAGAVMSLIDLARWIRMIR